MKSKTKSKHINTLHAYADNLRKNATPCERELLALLQENSKYHFKFQAVIPPYISDFLIRRLLIIELDGEQHDSQIEYDSHRDSYLKEWGFEILRFTNKQFLARKEEIVGLINKTAASFTRQRTLKAKRRLRRLYAAYSSLPRDNQMKRYFDAFADELAQKINQILQTKGGD